MMKSFRYCVMCGNNQVQRKQISVRMKNGKTVKGIYADVCPVCGEQYFDLVAMNKIETARRSS